MAKPKLLIIGLDCMEPSLVFDQWRQDLPTLSRLMSNGSYGRMESCIPAITVPAWSCMMSGRDPGELGIYGFRNRRDRNYHAMAISDGRAVKAPRLWDFLSKAGWKVTVISVPGTSPPYEVNGLLVSCFLTPNTDTPYTHPPELADRIKQWMPDFLLDVPQFRSTDKQRILNDIYRICDQRFTLASKLIAQEEPDFLMMVDMGVDRIHHAFWKSMDPGHPQYRPNAPFATAIHDYYRHVDQHIGQLLEQCSPDTSVLIVSDHGARPLLGGICINEWLIEKGYLTLKETPTTPTPLDQVEVDWSKTQVWGAGGYYARIFLNVKGREPEGIVSMAEYGDVRSRLEADLKTLTDPDGNPIHITSHKPQETYQRVRGMAPDLIVYFDDLAWRSVGSVGIGSIHTQDNDTGPDDANHAPYGLMIFHDPQAPQPGEQLEDISLYDILPTILHRFGIEAPLDLRGTVLSL
ncbi:MAG: alkaline phosphatase family protein [Cyanobacteria bacterium P01_F01_bin.150]